MRYGYGKMPPLKWILKPWGHCVHMRESFCREREHAIAAWLDTNAHSGWRYAGTVKCTDDERAQVAAEKAQARKAGVAIPYLVMFVGIEFKNIAEAVIFKMVLHDFEKNVAP